MSHSHRAAIVARPIARLSHLLPASSARRPPSGARRRSVGRSFGRAGGRVKSLSTVAVFSPQQPQQPPQPPQQLQLQQHHPPLHSHHPPLPHHAMQRARPVTTTGAPPLELEAFSESAPEEHQRSCLCHSFFSLSSITKRITNGALIGRFLKMPRRPACHGQRVIQATGARSRWEGMAPMGIPRGGLSGGGCSVGSRTRDRPSTIMGSTPQDAGPCFRRN